MKYFFVIKRELLDNAAFLYNVCDGKEQCLISNTVDLKEAIQRNKIKNYNKLPPFRKGSIVRLTREIPNNWNNDGEMDHFLGREVELTDVNYTYIYFKGQEGWHFMPSDIEEVIRY